MRRIKKILFSAAVLLLLLSSCSQEQNLFLSEDTVEVRITVSSGSSRTILPPEANPEDFSYRLTGTSCIKTSFSENYSSYDALTSSSLNLLKTQWNLKLEAFEKTDEAYEAPLFYCLKDVDLSSDAAVINFTLKPENNGKGTVEVSGTISSSNETEIAAYAAFLYSDENTSLYNEAGSSDDSSSWNYKRSEVPAGTYNFVIVLYSDSYMKNPVANYSERLIVSGGRTTAKEGIEISSILQKPEEPTSLTAGYADGILKISWEDNSSSEEGFILTFSDGTNTYDSHYFSLEDGNLNANSTTVSLSGFGSGTWSVEIKAYNNAGESNGTTTEIEIT